VHTAVAVDGSERTLGHNLPSGEPITPRLAREIPADSARACVRRGSASGVDMCRSERAFVGGLAVELGWRYPTSGCLGTGM